MEPQASDYSLKVKVSAKLPMQKMRVCTDFITDDREEFEIRDENPRKYVVLTQKLLNYFANLPILLPPCITGVLISCLREQNSPTYADLVLGRSHPLIKSSLALRSFIFNRLMGELALIGGGLGVK
jgi:hypothetical protein